MKIVSLHGARSCQREDGYGRRFRPVDQKPSLIGAPLPVNEVRQLPERRFVGGGSGTCNHATQNLKSGAFPPGFCKRGGQLLANAKVIRSKRKGRFERSGGEREIASPRRSDTDMILNLAAGIASYQGSRQGGCFVNARASLAERSPGQAIERRYSDSEVEAGANGCWHDQNARFGWKPAFPRVNAVPPEPS